MTSDGGRYRAVDLRLLPAPLQRTLPIMIGGSGPKRTLRVVARYADMWNAFGWPADVGRSVGILRQHCTDVGRDIQDIELTVGANVIIRPRLSTAKRVWAEQMELQPGDPADERDRPVADVVRLRWTTSSNVS